jgi:hypothetical protein
LYKKLVIVLAVILLALVAERFVFTTSTISVDITPPVLRASIHSELQIDVYRENMLGFRVPFSNAEVLFAIEEGSGIIELIGDSSGGTVKVRSKGVEGEASVGIYSVKSGLKLKKVLIKILPADAA